MLIPLPLRSNVESKRLLSLEISPQHTNNIALSGEGVKNQCSLRIFVRDCRYRQLNADIVPIKSLYIEAGSKRLEPGEKYRGLYGKLSVSKWSYFSPF